MKATEFRDQLLIKHPPISRKEFCNARRSNNKTGITGVYTYSKPYKLKDGSIRETWYWEANWPDAVGVSISKSFSVKRYGEKLAKQMAINARNNGLRNVKGTFWAAERGELNTAKKMPTNRFFLDTQTTDKSNSPIAYVAPNEGTRDASY